MQDDLVVCELFAGAGGFALGLQSAGFRHRWLIDNDRDSYETLRSNKPHWPVTQGDVRDLDPSSASGADLLACGLPTPSGDDSDLADYVANITEASRPRALLLETVADFARSRYSEIRGRLVRRLEALGYAHSERVLYSASFGVPQLRPRAFLVALRDDQLVDFTWPSGGRQAPTVGDVLREEMAARGWTGATRWADEANTIAPTLVGGSRKHGGADLGPTGSKTAWRTLRVNPTSIADDPPAASSPEMASPRLTLRMVALLQGFEPSWRFFGGKTSVYRQITSALPPPTGSAVAEAVAHALRLT